MKANPIHTRRARRCPVPQSTQYRRRGMTMPPSQQFLCKITTIWVPCSRAQNGSLAERLCPPKTLLHQQDFFAPKSSWQHMAYERELVSPCLMYSRQLSIGSGGFAQAPDARITPELCSVTSCSQWQRSVLSSSCLAWPHCPRPLQHCPTHCPSTAGGQSPPASQICWKLPERKCDPESERRGDAALKPSRWRPQSTERLIRFLLFVFTNDKYIQLVYVDCACRDSFLLSPM